jgi:hypothetical protein
MKILTAILTLLLIAGCGDDETNPLSSKEEQLIGSWRLDIEAVDDEDFGFTYSFARDKSVVNKMGGAFLKRLQEIEGIDIGRLKGVDGGTVNLRGRWTMEDDTLEVVFETLDVALFGSVLGVQISVPVHQLQLPPDEEYRLSYTCSITGDELIVRGRSLTVGVPLGQAVEAELSEVDLGRIGKLGLELASDFLVDVIRQEHLDEAAFIRVR